MDADDDSGRRTSVETSGEAFNSQTAFNSWGYNPKSELTSSRRYTGEYDPTPDPQDEVLAEKRLYGYDQIGNRLESTEGTASATTYGANNVNAYDWVQRPSPDPQEYFCYDDDGNLKLDGKTLSTCPGTDGLREFKWDAENRLIEVVPVSPSNDPPRNKKVKFVYDYMGRRVRKQVFDWTGSAWSGTASADLRFVYDGWNVIMVLDGLNSNAVTRKYTWGLDLSSTLHGAGGIGGLLACEEPLATGGPKQYWFMYDANGNVGQVLDATSTSSITIAAHYEYDPYGNVINNLSSYTYATANPFRFSTKWFDAETGLGYWGYRYYSPRLGRWISRDPIGEEGGLNIYAFVGNEPTQRIDLLGEFGPLPICLRGCSGPPIPPAPPVPPLPSPPLGGACGADVTDWLVDELNKNANARVVRDVKHYCCGCKPSDYAVEISDFSGSIGYLWNCYSSAADWRDMVKPGGPWDYKAHRKRYWPMEGAATGTCKNTITICGKCYNRDVPGNINFGFTGKLACFAAKELHDGADKAAGGKDSSGDYQAIEIGIRLAQSGQPVTRASLCGEFDKQDAGLEKAETEGCTPSSLVFGGGTR